MDQRKSRSTKRRLPVDSQLYAAWKVINRHDVWNSEEIIEALYREIQVTRLGAGDLLRWMLQHGIVTRTSINNNTRKFGGISPYEGFILSKDAEKTIHQLLPHQNEKRKQ